MFGSIFKSIGKAAAKEASKHGAKLAKEATAAIILTAAPKIVGIAKEKLKKPAKALGPKYKLKTKEGKELFEILSNIDSARDLEWADENNVDDDHTTLYKKLKKLETSCKQMLKNPQDIKFFPKIREFHKTNGASLLLDFFNAVENYKQHVLKTSEIDIVLTELFDKQFYLIHLNFS